MTIWNYLKIKLLLFFTLEDFINLRPQWPRLAEHSACSGYLTQIRLQYVVFLKERKW